MKAVVVAYSNMGCAGIRALRRAGIEIVAVFTHADDPNENRWFDSVAELATSLGIPVYAPEDINHPIWVKRIRDLQPDILFSFYYRNLLKRAILAIPARGCLNLHGSLLPAYRGRAPINWVLVNGEAATGVTLHYMTPRADDGDIVAQVEFPIADEDTALDLHRKSTVAAEGMLDEILPAVLAGNAPRTPQDPARATYFGGRKPADGEIDWSGSGGEVRNLVRAVTKPFPGAFTHAGDDRILIWSVAEVPDSLSAAPGTVLSLDPWVIACGQGAVEIRAAQPPSGVHTTGVQVARDLNLIKGSVLGTAVSARLEAVRRKRILILGINGFIGSALGERLLESGKFKVHGLDLRSDYVSHLVDRPGFHFMEGDISIHREYIEYQVRNADVVLPLVAIATPIEYTRNPLRVFELDFEENLRIIRYCVKYHKRVVFPCTSEVYGMCQDESFDEDNSNLVLGPIRMQRWIYSCSKQLLDRVIWAYGQQQGLRFTLFRPFNWLGPKLDRLSSARIGSSRAITQLILNLVEGAPIQLVDGGAQKRCFTDVEDAIEALYRIIEDKDQVCDRQILNIGNPENEASIRELAEILVDRFDRHPLRERFPAFAGYRDVESGSYYGQGYQDVQHRKPSIRNAKRLLNWTPTIGLEQSVEKTLDFFLRQALNPDGTTIS